VPLEEQKSRKAFVRIAAMGFEGLHMPAEMWEGRFEEEVASLECLWRGALRTGWVSWDLAVFFLDIGDTHHFSA
jgi:hypothetical protein